MAKYKYMNLISVMIEKEITQKELSKILGISYTSVRNKLADRNEWTISEIETLCNYFKKNYYELFKKVK